MDQTRPNLADNGTGKVTPRIIVSPALILAGRNGNFAIGPTPGIKDLWAVFMEDFGRIAGQVDMKAYGVCHNFDGAGAWTIWLPHR